LAVGILYVAALIVGLGTIALQLLLGGDGHGDGGGGGHADAGGDAGHADHDGDGHGAGGGMLPIFVSLRFWTFALFGFGMTGTLLYYLQLASRSLTLILALAMGLGIGLIASLVFRALYATETTSGGDHDAVVGAVGRVLVPVTKERRGKVRIEVKGQLQDVLASTDDVELPLGARVLVEEVRGSVVHVSRLPAELLGSRGDS
jgi:membrane protein implicated in regulation of membrane protease activity